MEILDRLGINTIYLLGYFVNFLIIFYVLNRFVFKKALKNIDERKRLTQELVNKNDETEKILKNAKKEFDEIVNKANSSAQEIINKANINAVFVADEIKLKAEEQSKAILERAEANIQKEHTNLKQELEKEVGELVLLTVNQVIKDLPEIEKNIIQGKINEKFA